MQSLVFTKRQAQVKLQLASNLARIGGLVGSAHTYQFVQISFIKIVGFWSSSQKVKQKAHTFSLSLAIVRTILSRSV